MKQLTADQIAKLKEPLPAEAVKQHPTKTFLSTIKAIYVVERLNDVFGIGAWKLKSQLVDNATAMIVVKATLIIEEYGIELESFGGNDNGGENSKNHDLGDAYKGATTDALTKICSYLGIGMDVFKGNPPIKNGSVNGAAAIAATTITTPKDLPWLNQKDKDGKITKEYAGAVEKLRSGKTTLDGIKAVRRISEVTETQLVRDWKSN